MGNRHRNPVTQLGLPMWVTIVLFVALCIRPLPAESGLGSNSEVIDSLRAVETRLTEDLLQVRRQIDSLQSLLTIPTSPDTDARNIRVSLATEANFRPEPSSSVSPLASIPAGTEVEAFGYKQPYFCIRYQDKVGYVHEMAFADDPRLRDLAVLTNGDSVSTAAGKRSAIARQRIQDDTLARQKTFRAAIADVPLDAVCHPEDCKTYWERAQIWVIKHAKWKIETANDVLIETYNPPNSAEHYWFRVTKEPIGGGRYRISLALGGRAGLPRWPSPEEICRAFSYYLTTGDDIMTLVGDMALGMR